MLFLIQINIINTQIGLVFSPIDGNVYGIEYPMHYEDVLKNSLPENIDDLISSKMHQFFFVSNKGICLPIGNWIQLSNKFIEVFISEKIKIIIDFLQEYEINNFQWTSTDAEIGNERLELTIKKWWKGEIYYHLFDYIHLLKSLRNQLIPPSKTARIIGKNLFNMFTLQKALDHSTRLAELVGDEVGK